MLRPQPPSKLILQLLLLIKPLNLRDLKQTQMMIDSSLLTVLAFKQHVTCLSHFVLAQLSVCKIKFIYRCNQGYAHKPDSTSQQPSQANQNVNCTYQQKRQMSAFLLEFFFPFGAGHFYSQRSLPGALKLVLFMFYCIGFCVFNSIKTPGEALFDMSVRMKMVGVCVSCLCCGLFIWQIADLISFGANSYRDGEGVPLASW